MAVISFNKQSTGFTASISGTITQSTTRLLNAYIKKQKLDVQSTTIKPTYGFTPSYQTH